MRLRDAALRPLLKDEASGRGLAAAPRDEASGQPRSSW
jgi:hypothetical protein